MSFDRRYGSGRSLFGPSVEAEDCGPDDFALADRTFWRRFFPPSTAEELRLHLTRFAPSRSGITQPEYVKSGREHREVVEHIAKVYDVDLKAESKSVVWTTDDDGNQVRDREAEAKLARARANGRLKKGRKLTDELRSEVWQLHEQGLRPSAISKRLNYGERSVIRILGDPRPLAESA